MEIFPAIDIYGGKVVRLMQGDYDKMTVYSDDPPAFAKEFAAQGAKFLHAVDLEGARDGGTPNFAVVKLLAATSGLKVEIGGGIRSAEVAEKYLEAGVWRVILGTAAVSDPDLLRKLVSKWGERVAVGVDVKDGFVAVRGWREVSRRECFEFCGELQDAGVRCVICTDVSRDGMLGGSNAELYRRLTAEYDMDFVASGGVSSAGELKKLAETGVYGAILGRALYEGRLTVAEALEAVK